MGFRSLEVTITLTPNRVVAEGGGRRVDVSADIWLGPPAGRHRSRPLLAIGANEASARASSIQVGVFAPGDLPPGLARGHCLGLLFREVLRGFIEQGFFRIKPHVIVRGAGSVRVCLGIKAEAILVDALRDGGAKTVTIET